MKQYGYLIIIVLSIISCKQESTQIQIVQQYYDGLNEGNFLKTSAVLSNQLIMRENQDNFEVAFSTEQFHDWFQWDSVFNPTYTVSNVHLKNDTVFAQITKCNRIMLLHEEPLSNKAYFEISNGKIEAINRYKYTNANWERWIKNRTDFLAFCATELPEYGNFINTQNLNSGQVFAKAIKIYKNQLE